MPIVLGPRWMTESRPVMSERSTATNVVSQHWPAEIGLAEIGLMKVGHEEVGITEVGPAEVDITEVGLAKLGGR